MITETKMLAMLLVFIVVPLPVYSTITMSQLQTLEKITTTIIQICEGSVKKVQRDFYRNGVHMQQVNITGVINGIPVGVTSPEYPADVISEDKTKGVHPCSPLPKKWHDDILWVLWPGNETVVIRRDHPDNWETYYPLMTNIWYTLKGTWNYYRHIPAYQINLWKQQNDYYAVASAVGGIIIALLAIPELGSKVIAGVLAVYMAVLAAYNMAWEYYLDWYLSTELGDGWTTCGKWAARWHSTVFWSQSFFDYYGGWSCWAACLMCPGGSKHCIIE